MMVSSEEQFFRSENDFYQSFITFDAALRKIESVLESDLKPATLVVDLDGVFNNDDFIFDAMALKLYEERLDSLNRLLKSYPNLNVVVVTARLDVYKWRDWIAKLESVLGIDGVEVKQYCAMLEPEYNALLSDLEHLKNGGERVIVTNVAKKPVIRFTGWMFYNYREHFKLPEDPLGDIFEAVSKGACSDASVVILDDGAMKNAFFSSFGGRDNVHYLELQFEAKKTKGLVSALVAILALHLTRKMIRKKRK